jgi:GH18 family chitinase
LAAKVYPAGLPGVAAEQEFPDADREPGLVLASDRRVAPLGQWAASLPDAVGEPDWVELFAAAAVGAEEFVVGVADYGRGHRARPGLSEEVQVFDRAELFDQADEGG